MRRALVGAGQKSGVFWALDRDTGEEVWSVEVGPGGLLGGVLNNGAYDGERVLVASHETEGETTRLVALSPADGAVLWERELDGLVTGPITTGGGVGFVPVSTRMLAFDVSDGEPLYEIETDATVSSGAAISGGRVAFGSGTAFFGFEMLDTVFIDGQALYFLSL
ncbi:MAG: PQQ-binding-like beta-propeller repeat protein [Myxococcales bacterium]|nr:PQQ-binding-like beta-propeller repeat protein [Myxococcales bacterium]